MKKYLRFILLLFIFLISTPSIYSQYAHLWTKSIGDSTWNWLDASVVDPVGNVYLLSETFSNYDLNPDSTVTNLVGDTASGCHYLAKYDTSGNYVWHRTSFFGGVYLFNIETDFNGNVIIAGTISGTAYIDDGSGGFDTIVCSGTDVVIIKYSPSGNLIFAKTLQATYSSLDGLFIDANSNIYLCGDFSSGPMDFDPGPGTSIANPTNNAGFFAKYDSLCNLLCYRVINSTFGTTIYVISITADNSGNIIITGPIDGGSADLGNGYVGNGQYIAKYDNTGNYIWHKSITGDNNFLGSIQTDNLNNIVLGGTIHNQNFDADPGVAIAYANGWSEVIILKLDSNGIFDWVRTFGGSGGDLGHNIVVDSAGNIYGYGNYEGDMVANPVFGLPFASNQGFNIYVVKFDVNGYLISLKTIPSIKGFNIATVACMLSIYENKQMVLTGDLYATTDFDFSSGISSLTSAGGPDIFFSKYALKNDHYLITGKVYSDVNNDSIFDAGDIPLHGVIVSVNPGGYVASTDNYGNYYCYVPQGNYNISIPVLPVHYASAFPASDTAVFVPLLSQVDTANNFALTPELNAQDLKINITNLGPARPGFPEAFVLTASNVGTVPFTPTVTAGYSDSLIYDSSYPVADSLAANFLHFSIDTLWPTHYENILTEYTVAGFIGDTVVADCHIYPDSNDLTPSDNKDKLYLILHGSYDPNYKEVFPDGALLPAQADTTLLTYTIHFQNTGTDTAHTIIIVDTLSSLLNVCSFVLEASSHPCTFVISGNGIIEFTFNNIMLPDSGSNQLGSCGFVKYSIRPLVGLSNGSNIENTAHIVFDFNTPINTNTVQTPIGYLHINIADAPVKDIFLSPNPSTSIITISHLNPAVFYSIAVKDVLGNTIITQKHKGSARADVNIAQLAAGIYFVAVESDGNTVVKKLVKQ